MGGLRKGIWHPLCQKAFLQFQHRSAFCCPSVTTARSRLQLDGALCFSLQPSPPAWSTPGLTPCPGGVHHGCRQLQAAAWGHQVAISLSCLL